jgi:hypothetical protein
MREITVLCPSRGRPQRWADMVVSAHERAVWQSRVTYLVMVDFDDPCADEYTRLMPAAPRCLFAVNRERLSAPALYNALAMYHASGEIVVAAADDVMFRTQGWDVALEGMFGTYPDGLWLAYFGGGGADGKRDKVEHFATTRHFVETVGYFMWPRYEHFCADEHMGEIARLAGRLWPMPSVVLEHMHFKYGKAERDETYASKRRRAVHLSDGAAFALLAGERQAAAERVRAAIEKAELAA